MSSTRSGTSLSVIFESLINFILSIPRKYPKHRTYDFTGYVCGRDYVFEPTDDQKKGYMTAQCKGIKSGDYIILQSGSSSYQYQIEEIDYYSEPPDMWIALLSQVIEVR